MSSQITDNRIIENAKSDIEYIDEILRSEPPEGWHVHNVGNNSQHSKLRRDMINLCEVVNEVEMGDRLASLVRLVERQQRELELYDEKCKTDPEWFTRRSI